jgi:hypothetical protein
MGPNMSGCEVRDWVSVAGDAGDARIMGKTVAPRWGAADYLSRNCRAVGAVRPVLRRDHFTEDLMSVSSSDRLLRRTLWGNALFSVLGGAALTIFAGPFAAIAAHEPGTGLGLELAAVFQLLGLGVVGFGLLCAWIASRETMPAGWARVILAADLAWVLGSVLVLAAPASWTTAGVAGIVVVALVVADLAVLEYLGLRRLGTAN